MIAADRTVAILLAAGRSARFGQDDKLLTPFDGRPLACHAAAMLAAAGFQALIAVCVPESPLAEMLTAMGFRVVPVSVADAGMAQSLADGMAAAQTFDPDAVLVHLADMPMVTIAHIEALRDSHDGGADAITASAYGGTPMPPALFGRAHFTALRQLRGDAGARALLNRATLVRASAAMLKDIDTPDDLAS
ncbi:nucleotidyltransferase family protein [Sphingobium boeckii]|uniref:Molybdenum cofactor cytidylyltransferase n=1 Tax=Sphingobium boeckii TaxID=1082345 RepID=A0A7W9AKL8_9SPHN|nr:nucleotidyltransferase family protein [Sphingobium boeckii]MBB5687283.1 molybdenum cofactor cytidylyltransferase [Sphingobium boeckii]